MESRWQELADGAKSISGNGLRDWEKGTGKGIVIFINTVVKEW
jgi:hypothetical protein